MSDFNLKKFREEFLQSDGWQVSDCYKPYDDKFLRRDAQDAYEGAKWAWNERQKVIELALKHIEECSAYGSLDNTYELVEILKGDNND